MAGQSTEESHLQKKPRDIVGVILTKLAKQSPEDFINTLSTCKDMGNALDNEVFRNLNLSPFVKKPLLSNGYPKVMTNCLNSNNLQAHYVRGILCYFNENKEQEGMHHFSISANGGHKESLYLYGIILLCNDRRSEGNHYLQQLQWVDNVEAADACWKTIKRSLHGIRVERKDIYFTSMLNMQPGDECHINDMDNTCEKCFGFKQVVKFLFMS